MQQLEYKIKTIKIFYQSLLFILEKYLSFYKKWNNIWWIEDKLDFNLINKNDLLNIREKYFVNSIQFWVMTE